MGNEYREYLEKELKEAQEKFEEAKREAIKEIENMNFHMAEDFGAAHTTHIDKITSAAARIKAIGEAMKVYDYFQNK